MIQPLLPASARRFLLLGAACFAIAARDTPVRDVAGWTLAPSEDGEGCFISKTYDHPGDTTLLLGLDRGGSNHLSVLNGNWSIRPNDRLALDFTLSKGAYPRHFAIGIAADGKQGFAASFEPRFPAYFATSTVLAIARGKTPVERLDLTGSGAAVAALRRCVEAQLPPRAGNADRPRDDSIPRDPFAPAAKPARR